MTTQRDGRWVAVPWWVKVLLWYAAARAVSAAWLLVVAQRQEANLWTPAAPSYSQYTGQMWDADWYRRIAEHGYPADLPRGGDGRVLQNEWAFFPLFPALARLLMTLTGGSWSIVAPTLALLSGAAAMVMLYRLVTEVVGHRVALLTVVLVSTFVSAPVLQAAYTESLALLLLATTLWFLLRGQYLLAVPTVLGLGLTRAVALPVVIAVLAHGWRRWRAGDREFRILPWGVLALASVVAGFLWPALVGLAVGQPDGYAQVQAAWRGRGEVVPLLPWLDVSRWLFGAWGIPLLLAVLALAVVAVLRLRLGPELTGWTAGYLGYLLLAVEPGTSLLRFLLLAFPLAGGVARWLLRHRWCWAGTGALVLAGVVGQLWWLWTLWRLVPPSGWPP